MAGPAYVHEPTVQYLHQLLDELSRGHLLIPRFQRSFVWDDEQRLELLRSIQEGLPIGAILVWRTEHTSLTTIREIGPHVLPGAPKSAYGMQSYLLDGLQRLSTLYGCLRPVAADGSPYVPDGVNGETNWNVAYELRAQQFEILDRDDAPSLTHLPLPLLLDSVGLLRFQRTLLGAPDAEELIRRADALAETFRTYKIPIVPLVTGDLATATRSFERINRQGTPMSELHMVRALTWTESFDLLESLDAIADKLVSEYRWGRVDLEWILKVCKALLDLDIAVEDPESTADALRDNSHDTIHKAHVALAHAIVWLRSRCHVDGLAVLPYRQQLVMVADVFNRSPELAEPAARELERWFWNTTYTERFSGITGNQTNSMLQSVRKIADGALWVSPKGKAKAPAFKLPATMNPTWASNRTAAITLARQAPLDESSGPIDAHAQLAERGLNALVALDPKLKTLAGRLFLARGTSDLRDVLLHAVHDLPEPVLRSHAITPEAAQALADGDLKRFERLRADEIARLQEAFYRSTQAGAQDDPDDNEEH